MKGKKMPQVGRVEVSIMEEDQARLLAFQKGELDLMNMEGPLAPNVLDGDKLQAGVRRRKGVKLSRFVDPEISYTFWNMQDPVVGGMEKEKIALRRAMAMAYNVDEEIRSCATARRSRRSSRSRRASSATTRSTARA